MKGVMKPAKSETSLLAPLERHSENGSSRIKIPKFSEHDLTNIAKKYHAQDPRTRKWLRIDSHGQAEVVEVQLKSPLQSSPLPV